MPAFSLPDLQTILEPDDELIHTPGGTIRNPVLSPAILMEVQERERRRVIVRAAAIVILLLAVLIGTLAKEKPVPEPTAPPVASAPAVPEVTVHPINVNVEPLPPPEGEPTKVPAAMATTQDPIPPAH